VNQKN